MIVAYPLDHSSTSTLAFSAESAPSPSWFWDEDRAISAPTKLEPLSEIVTVKWSTTDRHVDGRVDLELPEAKISVRLFGEKDFVTAGTKLLLQEIQNKTILPPPADCDLYWWCYEVMQGKPSRLIAKRHKLTNVVQPC